MSLAQVAAILKGAFGFATTVKDAIGNVIALASGVSILPPPAPTNIFALAGNAGASVQFTGSLNGAATSWLVTSSGGQTATVNSLTGLIGNATITGLTNGVAYTFTVAAINSYGTSVASLVSNSVTPTATPAAILPVTRGLTFWYSAYEDNIVNAPSNGATMNSLVDFSGNGFNAAKHVGQTAGTWVASWSNSKPAIYIDGTGQNYDTGVSGLLDGMWGLNETIYLVYDIVSNIGTQPHVIGSELPNNPSGFSGFFLGSGAIGTVRADIINNGAYFTTAATYTAALAASTPAYATITRPGAFRLNGTPVAGLIDGVVSLGNPFTFGDAYADASYHRMQGHFAEIVIFNVVHTPAEIALMETYLATRY
jgi:hypothetical protein